MSTCGASRSRKTWGALGISSERSFTYTFSMEKTGWLFCAASLMKLPSEGIGLGASGCGEQRIEPARAVECGEVVVAADVALAHVDLRHGAAAGALHHFLAALGLEVDADLLDLAHALRLE